MNKTILITGRYEAGEDAVQILAHRRVVDDDAFFAGIKEQFGG